MWLVIVPFIECIVSPDLLPFVTARSLKSVPNLIQTIKTSNDKYLIFVQLFYNNFKLLDFIVKNLIISRIIRIIYFK
jgi:hypothetical protein